MDKFHYEANGYNRSEVNAFIERVIRETEGIINKCQEQKDEIKDLKDKLIIAGGLNNKSVSELEDMGIKKVLVGTALHSGEMKLLD